MHKATFDCSDRAESIGKVKRQGSGCLAGDIVVGITSLDGNRKATGGDRSIGWKVVLKIQRRTTSSCDHQRLTVGNPTGIANQLQRGSGHVDRMNCQRPQMNLVCTDRLGDKVNVAVGRGLKSQKNGIPHLTGRSNGWD